MFLFNLSKIILQVRKYFKNYNIHIIKWKIKINNINNIKIIIKAISY